MNGIEIKPGSNNETLSSSLCIRQSAPINPFHGFARFILRVVEPVRALVRGCRFPFLASALNFDLHRKCALVAHILSFTIETEKHLRSACDDFSQDAIHLGFIAAGNRFDDSVFRHQAKVASQGVARRKSAADGNPFIGPKQRIERNEMKMEALSGESAIDR